MSKRLIALLAGVMAIAIVAAGCGSSSDDSSDTTAVTVTVSKSDLIAQGDAICKQGDQEIEEGVERFVDENNIPEGKEPTNEQGVELVETVIVPNIKTQAELIRELGIPEGDEEKVEAMLDSLDEAVEKAEDDPEALFEDDSDPFGKPNKAARDYGFKVCGQS